ncbi:MAG: threonine synthase [Bdellovibrionales bacterium]|nr:threonine synthase [Bdellovibrionales bacterium]
MKYVSTRGSVPPTDIRTAIEAGIASDGGLYVPESLPKIEKENFKNITELSDVAITLLSPFFGTSAASLCKNTFSFPIPLSKTPRSNDFILELYHGPTGAFKDVGAKFLAGVMSSRPSIVMVATSGDTGGAVAAAFAGQPGFDVVVLYPKGKISTRQESQIAGWGQNVRAVAVEGSFDDCQRLVKESLLKFKSNKPFLSANSINLGRILPQMAYYAHAALSKPGLNFIIPSGNLGNSLACIWAKKMGLPIGEIILAFNANQAVVQYLKTGTYTPTTTVPTLANAMDVGNPSNLERLQNLYPSIDELRRVVRAETVNDDEIRKEIESSEKEWGQVLCPHSAVAAAAKKRFNLSGPTAIVATAHPSKFETIIEPIISREVKIPTELVALMSRSIKNETIKPEYTALEALLKRSIQ